MIGMALMTAACLMFLPGGLHWLVAGLAVAGIGQGFAFNTSTTAAMDAVPTTKSGAASGVLNAARQLGSTFGIAGAGAVFQTIESRGLLTAMQRPRRARQRAGRTRPRTVLGLAEARATSRAWHRRFTERSMPSRRPCSPPPFGRDAALRGGLAGGG